MSLQLPCLSLPGEALQLPALKRTPISLGLDELVRHRELRRLELAHVGGEELSHKPALVALYLQDHLVSGEQAMNLLRDTVQEVGDAGSLSAEAREVYVRIDEQ